MTPGTENAMRMDNIIIDEEISRSSDCKNDITFVNCLYYTLIKQSTCVSF